MVNIRNTNTSRPLVCSKMLQMSVEKVRIQEILFGFFVFNCRLLLAKPTLRDTNCTDYHQESRRRELVKIREIRVMPPIRVHQCSFVVTARPKVAACPILLFERHELHGLSPGVMRERISESS